MSKAKSSFPAIEHNWVVEAMIASYNHVYKVVHDSKYRVLGPIGVSDYGETAIAPFQIEFIAMNNDPGKVVRAIRKYKTNDRKHVLDVFHEMPSPREIKTNYAKHGYEFIRTGPILGLDLPAPMLGGAAPIKKIGSDEELGEANKQLAVDNESIPARSLYDPHIHNYVAEWNGRIVGWTQLVTIFPGVGYINQLYTLMDYRNRRIGCSLVAHVHSECDQRGIKRMALVPSDMALGLYRRFGYRPLVFFTTFRPKEEGSS